MDDLSSLMGMRVYSSPLVQPIPVISLSPRVTVSDAFRRDFDGWLRGMFGMKEVCFVIGDGAGIGPGIVMNPKQIAMLRGVRHGNG